MGERIRIGFILGARMACRKRPGAAQPIIDANLLIIQDTCLSLCDFVNLTGCSRGCQGEHNKNEGAAGLAQTASRSATTQE